MSNSDHISLSFHIELTYDFDRHVSERGTVTATSYMTSTDPRVGRHPLHAVCVDFDETRGNIGAFETAQDIAVRKTTEQLVRVFEKGMA